MGARGPLVTLDVGSQPLERLVPLTRDRFEELTRVGQPNGLELPYAFAPFADVPEQAGAGKDLQMLADRLPRNAGSVGEIRDRQRPFGAQALHEAQPTFIAEREEQPRFVAQTRLGRARPRQRGTSR